MIKKSKIKNKNIEIPKDIVEKWQGLVNLLAENNNTPDVLITRVDMPYLEVYRASENKENPFSSGDKVKLAGHYCQHVINTKDNLEVNNAKKEIVWKDAPELEENLIAYIGYPLEWPDGSVFGTLCSHDYKERKFESKLKKYMKQAKELIESHLKIIYQNLQLKESQKKYKKLLEKSRILLDNIEIQVWFLNDINTYGMVNKAHANFFDLKKDEMKNRSLNEIMSTYSEVKQCMKSNKEVFDKKEKVKSEEIVKNANGEKRILSITKTPKLNKDGKVDYVVCSAIDITEQRKKEEKIKYISYHDSLTGLYNRSFLEEEIKRLNVKRKLPITLIMADLNGLKLINDSYGHKKGDELLINAADVLKDSCRKEDIISRWGGDEFLILLAKTTKEDGNKIIERIKNKAANFSKNNSEDNIPLSIALGAATKNNENENIYDILEDAEDKMYKNKLMESSNFKSNIVKTLLKTLNEKSEETKAHSLRMKNLAIKLAKKLNLTSIEINKLALLAKLHDIGKVVIDKEILNKKSKLSKKEWKKIKEHPATAHRICSSTEKLAYIAKEILYHHEHWDGSGYPHGLSGEKIPLLSRIISIVDAYDVMTHEQPYQKKKSKKEAITELKKCAGTQFDPDLVDHFIEILE
ncbi:MAG: diguanylate cyclase domain-containing protein [Bacillota bacterium]